MTRLGAGLPVAVNPDLIERIEETPDTVVTLVDGHKLVVEEPLDDVVAMIRSWRASVAAEALVISHRAGLDDSLRDHPSGGAGSDHGSDHDPSEAAFADRAGSHAQLGRVLRMPRREV